MAYLTCFEDVWDGFLGMVDAIATAGEAADTGVFCEVQAEWGGSARQLGARHAECPRPADAGLLAASDLLQLTLDELEQATGLYAEFCHTQDLNVARDANEQLGQAVSHAGDAYEALTGQPFAGPAQGDVNAAWVECVSDLMLGLFNLFDEIESAPEVHSLAEFCAPIGGWATSLAGMQAEYALCTPPTDTCLLTVRESLEAWVAELSAAFQCYGEACATNDDGLVEQGNHHFTDALRYAEQTADALRQCGGE